MSVTALIGTNAQFHCAGTGNYVYLVWKVDGLAPDYPDILARGIKSDTTSSLGTVQSTLTVPAMHISEQWYYCTMCYQVNTVRGYNCSQQQGYLDYTAR